MLVKGATGSNSSQEILMAVDRADPATNKMAMVRDILQK